RRRPDRGARRHRADRRAPDRIRGRDLGDDDEAFVTPANKPLTGSDAFSLQPLGTVGSVSTIDVDLRTTVGFRVTDAAGRLLGLVECPMYGTRPDEPDALSVRARRFFASRRMVPMDAISEIDGAERRIDLRVDRDALPRFL